MDGARLALVVANDEYADPGLRRLVAPAHDAEALAEALADPAVGDFDVQILHNESAQGIRFAVEDFFADRAPEDLLLLHFSCHGLKNAAGELFLAVADTRPTRLASTAVAADFVNRQMADSRAQRIALFLDCCYGGAFPRGMVVRAAGEAQVRDAFAGQDTVGGGRGRVVITASSAMEYAFEDGRLAAGAEPSPSVFTGAVVDGLTTGEADRDGDGWVGLTELVGYVTDRVHRVTPNQNPQMWTFGSQGELLIARSRVRRVTATPLPAELLEAMDSPLTATRFGVVDDLRGRLRETDLGQAYAAWQALQRMVDDDSRKVSEAARRGVEAAVPRVIPEALELGTVDSGPVVGELTLSGPPIALVAVADAGVSWLRVEQDGAVARVVAEPEGAGEYEGAVLVSGPTGECTVPVRLRVAERPAVPVEPPESPVPSEPSVPPAPVVQPSVQPSVQSPVQPSERPPERPSERRPERPAVQPSVQPSAPAWPPKPTTGAAAAARRAGPERTVPESTTPAATAPESPGPRSSAPRSPAPESPVAGAPAPGSPGASGGMVPWWAIGVLAAGAVALVVANWPGAPESEKAWYDDVTTGWHVYRSWTDQWLLASIIALAGALSSRRPVRQAGVALGVVGGGVALLVQSSLVILAAALAYDNEREWAATLLVAAAMGVVVLAVLRPRVRALVPVWPPAAIAVLAGGVLLIVAENVKHADGYSFFTVTGLAFLGPLVAVALGWLAIAPAADPSYRPFFVTMASTYALLSIMATLPALTHGDSAAHFLTALAGDALVLAGIAAATWADSRN